MLEEDGDIVIVYDVKQALVELVSRDTVADLILAQTIVQLINFAIRAVDGLPFNRDGVFQYFVLYV